MNKLLGVFSASILLVGCLAAPTFAKDDIEVDVDGLCEAADSICRATCHLSFPGSGFSDQLSLDLCVHNCTTSMLACMATGDDVILRQTSRSKDAIKRLQGRPLPMISD